MGRWRPKNPHFLLAWEKSMVLEGSPLFFLDDDEYRCKELQKRVPQQTTVKGP